MAKLTEYPSTSIFDKEDILILDGVNGTRKIKVKDAAKEFAGMISIVQNRNIYGGANLGNSVTDEQKTAIKNGTFKDLYVGDYWTIDGVNYRIADMDYWYRSGDVELLKHHLVIVPDTYFYATKMNETDITTGGYVGSKMRLENLEEAKSKIKAAFGELVLMRREYLVNAVTNGQSSSGAWFDSDVELMNEIMVYGTFIHTPTSPNMFTTCTQQLSLFRLNPSMTKRRYGFWLRDVVSSTSFASVNNNGTASRKEASSSYGVRPVFAIG